MIGAGSPRAAELLAALVKVGADVTHFPTLSVPPPLGATGLRIAGVKFVKRRSGKLTWLGPFLKKYHPSFDVILVSRLHNLIEFNKALRDYPQIRALKTIIFDAEAIVAFRESLRREVLDLPLQASDISVDEEVELARDADIIIAVNELDAAPFRIAGYANVKVIGHAISPRFGLRPHDERSDYLFVGPTYADDTPNSDSVVWFVDRVLPYLRTLSDQAVKLTHVGVSTAPKVLALGRESIISMGPIEDMSEQFDRARVFVAPTRFASGIPLKVCEAAASGVPCVLQPILARQLGWEHEREALVAETPEEFARQCARLFNDSALWETIRRAAHQRIIEDFGRAKFDLAVADVCSAIIRMKPASVSPAVK